MSLPNLVFPPPPSASHVDANLVDFSSGLDRFADDLDQVWERAKDLRAVAAAYELGLADAPTFREVARRGVTESVDGTFDGRDRNGELTGLARSSSTFSESSVTIGGRG